MTRRRPDPPRTSHAPGAGAGGPPSCRQCGAPLNMTPGAVKPWAGEIVTREVTAAALRSNGLNLCPRCMAAAVGWPPDPRG